MPKNGSQADDTSTSDKEESYNKEKYAIYYDDSSDEEEEQSIVNYRLKDKAENFLKESSLKISDSRKKIAFILHELGGRILKSPQVNIKYYQIKKQLLSNNQVLDDETLKDVIYNALGEAINKISPDFHPEKSKEVVQTLEAMTLAFVENKRQFIKAVSSNKIFQNDLLTYWIYRIAFLLPDTKEVISQNILINKIIQCFQLIGEKSITNKDNKISLNASIKSKLSELKKSMNSFANKSIIEGLLNIKRGGILHVIVMKHFNIEDFQQLDSELNNLENITKNFFDAFQASMEEELLKISENIYRSNLEETYSFKLKDYSENPALALLIAVRLNNRSTIRIIKNRKYGSIFGEVAYSADRTFVFQCSSALSTLQLSSNQVRDGKVKNFGKYSAIYKMVENIKKASSKFNDKYLADLIIRTMHGEDISELLRNEVSLKRVYELQYFINSLTLLLFGFESSRNPASLIINFMMLDLIRVEEFSWKDVFDSLKMPMAIENAVSGARTLNSMFSQYTSNQYEYDKSSHTNGNQDTAESILQKEVDLCRKWFKHFYPKVKCYEKMDIYVFANKIYEKINKDWYKIDISFYNEIQENAIEAITDLVLTTEELFNIPKKKNYPILEIKK